MIIKCSGTVIEWTSDDKNLTKKLFIKRKSIRLVEKLKSKIF